MQKRKKTWLFAVCLVMMFLFSMNVSAAVWDTAGYTKAENGTYILTEKGHTASVGQLRKSTPIDTRKGFTLSFDYWAGEYSNPGKQGFGFKVVFANEPIDEIGDWQYMGYDEFITDKDRSLIYRAVEFNSHNEVYGYASKRYGSYVNLQKNVGQGYMDICSRKVEICDDAWHTVTLQYANGILSVFRDGTLFLSGSDCSLAAMTYVAFTGSTGSSGTQTTKIRNVRIQAQEPSLVIFNANGGSVSPGKAYILKNSNVSLPTPAKYGNTFLGWYTSNTGGVKVTSVNDSFALKQTLYARWKDNTVKMTFHANGGTNLQKTKAVLPKSKIGSLPTPARSGYTFLGWYTKKSGGSKISASYVMKKNTTVYAHWVKNSKKITVKLYKNGGSCKKSSIKVTCGGKLTGLPVPTRKGYIFKGWYTKKSGGTKVTSSTKTMTIYSTKKLYAQWKKRSSSSYGGSGSSSKNCAICHNTRRCKKCGGSGYIYNYVTKKYNRNCTKCGKTGRCIYCR